MPYGVGVLRYNEPIRRQSNLYPTVNYRRYPPGLGGCLGCGLGADAASSSGWLSLVGAAAGYWGVKKLTGSFLLGLVGGYLAYEVLSPTPAAVAAATVAAAAAAVPTAAAATTPPTAAPGEYGCTSPWTLVEGQWTCS
jgi:hypothetical protein